MVEHCLPGWETARQIAPRTARTEHIKDRVENAAEGMTSCSTIALGSTQILLQALPLGIREVAWIGRIHAEHCNLSCCCLAYKTRSREREFDTVGEFGSGLPPRLDASSREGEISPFPMWLPSVKSEFANSIELTLAQVL